MSVQSALTYFFLKRTKISSFEMASTVTKQQYYRRLMKEQKSKTSSAQATRVTHSLARFIIMSFTLCACVVGWGWAIVSQFSFVGHLRNARLGEVGAVPLQFAWLCEKSVHCRHHPRFSGIQYDCAT